MEEYKNIQGYEFYSVSNFGNVRNNRTLRILKPGVSGDGYYTINLCNGINKPISMKIHKLVGKAFIENPKNKRCIDHIDRNKLNNKVENLRWATHSENNMNKKLYSNNKTKCKGIKKRYNRYHALITIHGHTEYIGSFESFNQAVIARHTRALELFGNYANETNV